MWFWTGCVNECHSIYPRFTFTRRFMNFRWPVFMSEHGDRFFEQKDGDLVLIKLRLSKVNANRVHVIYLQLTAHKRLDKMSSTDDILSSRVCAVCSAAKLHTCTQHSCGLIRGQLCCPPVRHGHGVYSRWWVVTMWFAPWYLSYLWWSLDVDIPSIIDVRESPIFTCAP